MIDQTQFRSLIIQPVLRALRNWTQEDEDLLMGTCAQESGGCKYLLEESRLPPAAALKTRKLGIGPFQMEPNTHDDIWKNFLPSRLELMSDLMSICLLTTQHNAEIMVYNLFYATAMARVDYLRAPEPIPKTLEGQANYYKKYWNSSSGKATADEYIENYKLMMGLK